MIGSTDGLLAFATENGYSVTDSAATAKAWRKANLYLLGLSWSGDPATTDQVDIFPRVIDGKEVSLPAKVEMAVYLIACEVIESGEDLNLTGMTTGPKVLSESVTGAVSTTYSEQSLYSDGFHADFLGAYLNEWLTSPISGARSANLSVSRG